MTTATSHRASRLLVPLGVQALVWCALTVAFAALLKLAGPQTWGNALRFAALNWMPWVVLSPVVFWFSGRFPFERGQLWRSIPAQVLGCVGCVAATLWVSTYFSYAQRPAETIEPPPASLRHEVSGEMSARGATNSQAEDGASAARGSSRADRSVRSFRPELPGRNGPGWWPVFGTMLLRANFDAAVYFIIVVAAHALAFYRRAQDRERHAANLAAGLSRAKLDALRLQLHPHFLFNTLNAISTLVHRDANAADELIADLSELLRLSLQTSEHEVPLARELELLECYLTIEQARLGERLRIVRQIDPNTLGAYVPTLMLQPIVENSVRHGIEPRLAPGTITIRATRSGNQLLLSVADDGVGAVPQPSSGRRGIGIGNTEARLHTLHGSAASLALATPTGGGFEVKVALPYRTRSREDNAPTALAPPTGVTTAPLGT